MNCYVSKIRKEVGSWKLEDGRRKTGVRSQKSEDGRPRNPQPVNHPSPHLIRFTILTKYPDCNIKANEPQWK